MLKINGTLLTNDSGIPIDYQAYPQGNTKNQVAIKEAVSNDRNVTISGTQKVDYELVFEHITYPEFLLIDIYCNVGNSYLVEFIDYDNNGQEVKRREGEYFFLREEQEITEGADIYNFTINLIQI